MKKLVLLTAIIPLLLISCSREPIADFTISDSVVGVGETVYFTNRSIDAEGFEWDFGDGYKSNTYNASHSFDTDGLYTVSLKVNYNGHVDIATISVSVIGASLEVTVEEWFDPYIVPNISIILYASIYDWENPKTAPIVAEEYTNADGVAIFDHLAAQRYYLDIWGPNHNNYALALDDVGFIETPVLIPGALTTFTAFVDYYPTVKKSVLSRFEAKAKSKLEATSGTHRSKADKK
jgi:PKD repeat protein